MEHNIQAHNNCNGNDHRWDLSTGVPSADGDSTSVRMCLDCGFSQMLDGSRVLAQFGLDGRPVVNVLPGYTVVSELPR